ncbi:hypothetical protein [Catenulispora pinisilvae]|uniref:hypothetical protein n=1 Tax=Catenulispora pinisilvae TaxID=2705253 RepID=UPI0018920CA4|nr:hypothetical protein [Catenulispora pinisilvae]
MHHPRLNSAEATGRTGGRRGLLALLTGVLLTGVLLTGVLLNAAFLTLAGPANNESFYFHRAVS